MLKKMPATDYEITEFIDLRMKSVKQIDQIT